MWNEEQTQEAVKRLTDLWSNMPPAEALQTAKGLAQVPFRDAIAAIERCFAQQTAKRRPTTREIMGHLSGRDAGSSSLSPRMRIYNEIDALDKEALDPPTVFLRGQTWECGTRGISRKIDPQGDWRPPNSRAVPMGDLSEHELGVVLGAYRRAPKLARLALRQEPGIPENTIAKETGDL